MHPESEQGETELSMAEHHTRCCDGSRVIQLPRKAEQTMKSLLELADWLLEDDHHRFVCDDGLAFAQPRDGFLNCLFSPDALYILRDLRANPLLSGVREQLAIMRWFQIDLSYRPMDNTLSKTYVVNFAT